ncbi:MAG: DsbA family protein [Myxococcota bacterium]
MTDVAPGADRIDEAELTVLTDVRQPFAYLALGPTIALARRRGLALNWLPCSVSPLKPPPPESEGDERSVAHRRNRARMIAREIETYAAAQGLEIEACYRAGGWSALERALLFVRAFARPELEAFLTSTFAAYWAVELDPEDVSAVAEFVGRHGADAAVFAAWAAEDGVTVAREVAESLRARGMSGAPAYHVAGEYFQGRQHLPMIEWLLDGRPGRGPI